MKIVDVIEELSKHPEGSFLNLLDFNDHHFGACDIKGESPFWEMHPETDEFFLVLDGRFEITLLDGDTPSSHTIERGSSFVVPAGLWHKPAAPEGWHSSLKDGIAAAEKSRKPILLITAWARKL